jgi:hypothetical protein
MIVGTCQELSIITGRTDCYQNIDEIKANMGYFYIETKQISSYFSAAEYNHPTVP